MNNSELITLNDEEGLLFERVCKEAIFSVYHKEPFHLFYLISAQCSPS